MITPGKIFIESAENWQRLVSVLRQNTPGTFKFTLPGEDENLVVELFPDQSIIVYSFNARRRRGRALPVADRSSAE